MLVQVFWYKYISKEEELIMNKLITQNDFITFLKENKTGLPLICFDSPKFQSSLLVKQLLEGEYGLCCFLLDMNKNRN